MKLSKEDRLVKIFKFIEVIFEIYCQSNDMADFLNLQGKLEHATLNNVKRQV